MPPCLPLLCYASTAKRPARGRCEGSCCVALPRQCTEYPAGILASLPCPAIHLPIRVTGSLPRTQERRLRLGGRTGPSALPPVRLRRDGGPFWISLSSLLLIYDRAVVPSQTKWADLEERERVRESERESERDSEKERERERERDETPSLPFCPHLQFRLRVSRPATLQSTPTTDKTDAEQAKRGSAIGFRPGGSLP